jgi:hypothetical protein
MTIFLATKRYSRQRYKDQIAMKRLLALTLAAMAGLSVAAVAAPVHERVRGTVSAVSTNALTVHTTTGKDVAMTLGSDTKYLRVVRSSLDHIETGSYIGTAAKSMGAKLVALEVVVFPPSMKGAGEGHYAWDTIPDTTLSGGTRTASTMTNGTVAATALDGSAATVSSTMTNGSVAATSAKGEVKQLTVTYKGGEQTILVPPTAPIVTFEPGAQSDLKAGTTVFVATTTDGGKTTVDRVVMGTEGVNPPM